jgi:exopolyphosphatase/guanosine-5'-triphosphate,3'-diphosphate pyrophosphatase
MRVATVDIGTNTVLLLVAERDASGEMRAIAERATITRLGEGVDKTRALSPAAVARTRACLEDYAGLARELAAEAIAIVGTSAMRDAAGGEAVRRDVRALFGVEARVLSGTEEARLTFRGAVSGLRAAGSPAPAEVLVFDIGGGSTEIVTGCLEPSGPRIAFATSYDVGSVRLTERHPASDPPSASDLARLRGAAAAALTGMPTMTLHEAPVGVAGTMTTLAAVSLRLAPYDGARVHGHVMTRQSLGVVVEELASVDLETRRRLPGMEPKRADVIVAGGLIALEVLDRIGADRVRVSDRGVRWGVAEELFA